MASGSLIDDDENGNEEEQPPLWEGQGAENAGIQGEKEKRERKKWRQSAYPPICICR